ncbi:hypothetical protein FisN_18Lh074 [Fistulifera solaris]|uniref:Uncharacterized protein n=1 Tax=Fistulifera solaris TaxID=1519565 RepID=A0A1Z5KDX7_FISSO|nr:hypothetical protein FisN_18Lh074 [Fistulifera solaris]|eukprot:GAX24520.1 hypothetical protein FisN_18Lh074 [Fistulifera solaris]
MKHFHSIDHHRTTTTSCRLDPTVVNADTLPQLHDMGLSFFATLCGRNRGAFVLQNHTWGCTALPPQFAPESGGGDVVWLPDANAIQTQYQGGNLTAQETVNVLNLMIEAVYQSTPNHEADPFACELGGLAQLQCQTTKPSTTTVRSVTLAGLFTEALWATGGTPLTPKQQHHFYTAQDFHDMHQHGLNTVQIPFPLTAFLNDDNNSQTDDELLDLLSKIRQMADDAQLQAILVLEGNDNDDAVTAAAQFCVQHDMSLMLPSVQSFHAARAVDSTLPLYVPINLSTIQHMKELFPANDSYVFGALSMDHTSTVADIASSTSVDDRMKLFYHESMACLGRSPLEYATCFQGIPVLVSSGFDAAVDNCVLRDTTSKFVDYGQCDRFEETIHSDWWYRHRQSFVARQLFSYEKGLGWSFAAWKLYTDDDNTIGVLDSWAKLLSFRDVAAAGLMPNLRDHMDPLLACLNPPIADFILGDDTLAPTPGPPPDCGNGWWNASIQDCTYWIPPAPTAVPTRAPITAMPTLPCPTCPSCTSTTTFNSSSMDTTVGVAGFLLGVVVMAIYQCVTRSRHRRGGYDEIPTMTV